LTATTSPVIFSSHPQLSHSLRFDILGSLLIPT
jgi:hypothetical protein